MIARTIAAVAAIGCATLPGCGGDATRVELGISSQPAWGLDHYHVRVGDRDALTEPLAQLELLLPDDMAGHPTSIRVWGLLAGTQIAYGTSVVTPELHGTVTGDVTLAEVACGTLCPEGAVVCADDGTIECRQQDNGCLGWSEITPCPATAPFCSNGTCAAACTDECDLGQTDCDSSVTMRTCGEFDGDDCRDWSSPVACDAGETCTGGSCASTCGTATCDSPPDPFCVDPQTVRTYDSMGTCGPGGSCDYASHDMACPDGCIAGACTCPATCDPEVVATGQSGALGIALDDTYVYWTDYSGATIMRRTKAPGNPETLAVGQTGAFDIEVDDTHIYWTDALDNTVMRRTKSPGGPETLATGQMGAQYLTLDDTHVYWTTSSGDTVMRRTKAPGNLETIATGQDGALGVAVDDAHIYWVTHFGNTVMRRTKLPGTPEPIATGQNGPVDVMVDGTHIYWTNSMGNTVMRRTKAAGNLETLASGQGGAWGLSLDDTHVYWASSTDNTVARRSKAPGSVEPLASGQTSAHAVAVDATHVYWTTFNGSTVMRLSRCACGL